MKASAILLLLCSACGSTSGRAAVVNLGPDKDGTVFQNNGNNSAGGGPGFFAGTNGNNSPRRALLSFDLTSIPAGATITDVQLTLTLGQASSATTATIGLFSLTQNWGEGATGSTATSIAGTGQGFAADPGDATWSSAFHPTTTWTTAGGDHNATASASLLLGTNTLNTAFTWLSTPKLVADVQGWRNNSVTNFGWELINANEATSSSVYAFYSSEWHTFAGGNASQEPVLRVTYTVPEPGPSLWLAGAAALWLARRRRDARAA